MPVKTMFCSSLTFVLYYFITIDNEWCVHVKHYVYCLIGIVHRGFWIKTRYIAGADPGFQVREVHFKKNRAEQREARKFLGYFVRKITILRKKIIFFPNWGGGRRVRPLWIRHCIAIVMHRAENTNSFQSLFVLLRVLVGMFLVRYLVFFFFFLLYFVLSNRIDMFVLFPLTAYYIWVIMLSHLYM